MTEALGILIDNYSFKMSFGFESFKRRQASLNKTFIFIEFFVLLMLVSCDKDNGSASKNSSGAVSYEEQDWNRNKQPDGLQIDTVWDGDTTIYF